MLERLVFLFLETVSLNSVQTDETIGVLPRAATWVCDGMACRYRYFSFYFILCWDPLLLDFTSLLPFTSLSIILCRTISLWLFISLLTTALRSYFFILLDLGYLADCNIFPNLGFTSI